MEQVVFINNRGQKVTVTVEGERTHEGHLFRGAKYLAECLGTHLKDGYAEMGEAILFTVDDGSEPVKPKPGVKRARRAEPVQSELA